MICFQKEIEQISSDLKKERDNNIDAEKKLKEFVSMIYLPSVHTD